MGRVTAIELDAELAARATANFAQTPSPLIRGRIEQRGDLGFGQLLSSHHSCLPGILKPAEQPIQARESIKVLRLRPKVRQTAASPAPLYLERRAASHGKP